MCKLALFLLVAVAGSCLVACTDKFSKACSHTLTGLNDIGLEMEKEGPKCMVGLREKYCKTGLTDMTEYMKGSFRFLKEITHKGNMECLDEFRQWAMGMTREQKFKYMERVKESMSGVMEDFRQQTVCHEKLGHMMRNAANNHLAWAEAFTGACKESFVFMNDIRDGLWEEESFPKCTLEYEEKYYSEGWRNIPKLIEGMKEMEKNVTIQERLVCAKNTSEWMMDSKNEKKVSKMVLGTLNSFTNNAACAEQIDEIIKEFLNSS